MKTNALRIHPDDNVAVMLDAVHEDGEVSWAAGEELQANANISRGHKVALQAIDAGEIIRKYGHPIGLARCAIAKGDHVHVHNLEAREA